MSYLYILSNAQLNRTTESRIVIVHKDELEVTAKLQTKLQKTI